MTTLLVTGGAGFIGGNFVLQAVADGLTVVNLDALTYAGNRDTLRTLEGNPRHVFVHGGIGDRALVAKVLAQHRPNRIAVGGFFGNLPIIPPSGAGRDSVTLRGSEYFDDTFWEPEAYFAWQDTIWNTLLSTGTVDVGTPRTLQPPEQD